MLSPSPIEAAWVRLFHAHSYYLVIPRKTTEQRIQFPGGEELTITEHGEYRFSPLILDQGQGPKGSRRA